MRNPTFIYLSFLAVSGCFYASRCEAQTYTITTVAGGGAAKGTPALMASLAGNAGSLAVDKSGNLYIADTGSNVICKVTATGGISVVAGDINGNGGGYYGDGGPAVGAGLNTPYGIAVDDAGNLYIADFGNSRIRKVLANGTISTVAGGGSTVALGGQATQTLLGSPVATAIDAAGNLFLAVNTGSGASAQVLKVTTAGIVTAFAGNPALTFGTLGDNGPATNAVLGNLTPNSLAIDAHGNVFIADPGNNRIRRVSSMGMITTVAGSNSSNYSGDGGPAINAGLTRPSGVAVDNAGNLYIADTGNYRIRRVASDGTIGTIAGTGKPDYTGDGGAAQKAAVNMLSGIAAGPSGAIYFTDVSPLTGAGVVRLLTPVLSAPSISPGAIVPINSSVNTVQPGEWVSIYGTNLANATSIWNGDFPKSLGGTSVTIDSKPAYLWFVSPTQINLQVPDETALGSVPVVVTTAAGSSMSMVTLAAQAPSFLLLDSKHVTGIIIRSDGSGLYGGGAYDLIGPTGNSLGYPTAAAKAGDTVELYGVGFGPTNPVVLAGRPFSAAAATTEPVKLLINDIPVTPFFAGLSGAGLYQINVTIPAGLGTGDLSLQATVNGVQTPSGVVIALR